MLSLYNIAKFDGEFKGKRRKKGVRNAPHIHVNRSPNNLRKPTSDLKLIVLTEVSELASESWLRRRSLSGRAHTVRPYNVLSDICIIRGPPKAAPTN